jgi:hypothetical protein
VLACPFCGAPETDRFDIEGRRFLVFQCMFSPRVEPGLSDDEIRDRLHTAFGAQGAAFFRGTCDALHVYVTKGDGARLLGAP